MKDARHTLMYLFPRQYGLHNVFTSEVNRQETVQPFQDYTLREQEIQALKQKRQGKEPSVPKRLKGNILVLVMQMQKLHLRCSYHALVKYYCPASVWSLQAAFGRS
jgi:telomerase reverse transcriptase